jgi:hypothetical protein
MLKQFAGSVGVDVRGVNEIATGLAKRAVHFSGFVLAAPQPQSSPKVIVPSAASETRSPLLPKTHA